MPVVAGGTHALTGGLQCSWVLYSWVLSKPDELLFQPTLSGGLMVHASRAAKARNGGKANSLSVEDWVAAANDLLVSENIRGVQIPALCLRLKVTKGSFYWHFSGREDLLRALLESWRRRMTVNIYSKLGRVPAGATSTLRALLALPRKKFSA